MFMTTLQLQAAQVQFGAKRLQHRMLRDATYRHWLMEQYSYYPLAEATATLLFSNGFVVLPEPTA